MFLILYLQYSCIATTVWLSLDSLKNGNIKCKPFTGSKLCSSAWKSDVLYTNIPPQPPHA